MRTCMKLVKYFWLILIVLVIAFVSSSSVMVRGNVLRLMPLFMLITMLLWIQERINTCKSVLVTLPVKREKIYSYSITMQLGLVLLYQITNTFCLSKDMPDVALVEWLCFGFMSMMLFAIELLVRMMQKHNALKSNECSLVRFVVQIAFVVVYTWIVLGFIRGELITKVFEGGELFLSIFILVGGMIMTVMSVVFMRLSIGVMRKISVME